MYSFVSKETFKVVHNKLVFLALCDILVLFSVSGVAILPIWNGKNIFTLKMIKLRVQTGVGCGTDRQPIYAQINFF